MSFSIKCSVVVKVGTVVQKRKCKGDVFLQNVGWNKSPALPRVYKCELILNCNFNWGRALKDGSYIEATDEVNLGH